jgi:hypothetical protein
LKSFKNQILKINLLKHFFRVSCHPSIFKRLQGSSNEIRELHLQFNEKSVLVENYIENADEDCRSVRLHYLLDYTEFFLYELKREVSLVFAWNDFNYIVDMAQQIECELRIRFSKTGKPLNVVLDTGASYTIQLVVMTLSEENSRRKNHKQKVVSYKELMNDYVQDQKLNIEGTQLEKVLSPPIYAYSSEVQQQNIEPNITEKDMDDIANTLARKNSNKVETANKSIANLSQYEQDEIENVMRDAEMFEDMDVDPFIEPPKRPSAPSLNLDSYQLQANLLDMQRIPEEPIDEEMEENESHNIIPSDPKPLEDPKNVGSKFSTQEKKEMRFIKNIFSTRRSQGDKLKNAKDICPGSDSEESYIEENE